MFAWLIDREHRVCSESYCHSDYRVIGRMKDEVGWLVKAFEVNTQTFVQCDTTHQQQLATQGRNKSQIAVQVFPQAFTIPDEERWEIYPCFVLILHHLQTNKSLNRSPGQTLSEALRGS